MLHRTSRVILATGGIGKTFWHTTNSPESTGDGLAMAARAGATLADLEFVQFHPTAFAGSGMRSGASLPLLTEALRGAGAELLDATGHRFMLDESPQAELATRDVVARAIHRRTASGEAVYLDMRPVFDSGYADKFPEAMSTARAAGFDPSAEPLPIMPAAHYHMGGVQVDRMGRSSLPGLWACGEVATTGVHGANRLASNSLLEGIVYARRVAVDVSNHTVAGGKVAVLSVPLQAIGLSDSQLADMRRRVRQAMSQHVGIARSRSGLERALQTLGDVSRRLQRTDCDDTPMDFKRIVAYGELQNAVAVARLVTLAALRREESRGAHFRDDYPATRPEWQFRQKMTLRNLEAVSAMASSQV